MANTAIESGIARAQEGVRDICHAIALLEQIAAARPEGYEGLHYADVAPKWIHLHARDGYDLARQLSHALGYVWKRSHNEDTGAIYYRAVVDGITVGIIASEDSTCKVVAVNVMRPRYELQCPNAAEVVDG